MDWTSHPEDTTKSFTVAAIIRAMQAGNTQAVLDSILGGATGQPVNSRLRPGTPSCPTYYIAASDAVSFLMVNGTETTAQALGYWNGLLGTSAFRIAQPINFYTQNAANAILADMDNLAWSAIGVPFNSCGYSLGGAIANHVSAIWSQRSYRNVPLNTTFGAPRTLNTRDAEFCGQSPSVRWMCDDDVVPLIPPSFAESPSTALLYGVGYQSRLANFVHPRGGLQITATGTTSAREVPDNAVWSTSGTLQAFLLQQDTIFGTPHSIQEYLRRLALIVPPANSPPHRLPTPAPEEQPDNVPKREQERAATSARQALIRQGEGQNSIPVTLPQANEFTTAKVEGVWIVSFQNSVIAVGPTKRRARALARLGNQFLRRLVTQAVVQPQALQLEFSDWLTEASDPASGVKPTMQINFPT